MKRIGLGIFVLIALVLVIALCFDAADDEEIEIEEGRAPAAEVATGA